MGLDVDKKFMDTNRMFLFVCGLFEIAVSNSEYNVEISLINRKVLYK
jgi:hypothetical protein